MKTSYTDNVSYGWCKWVTATNTYRQTIGTGGGFANVDGDGGGSSYFLPNVVGMTFSWRREGDYDKRYCGFKYFGMNYYSPSRRKWRTVRFSKNTTENVNGHKDYYSPEGDRWQQRGGDPTIEDGGDVDLDWNPISASLSQAAVTAVLEDDWLWGGVWFELQGYGKGGKGNKVKIVKIADVQPIFGPYLADGALGPRIILPAPLVRTNGSSSDNYLTKGMYLRI